MNKTNVKLTFDDMILHLKSKNITFNKISEVEAKHILRDRNYFFKLRSYRNNFDRDQYQNHKSLDFSMLMDFSIIDSRLRTFVLSVALNIEHSLKTRLLQLITDDPTEDGYKILTDFLNDHNKNITGNTRPLTIHSLWGHATKPSSNLTYGMYKKYKKNPPVWVIFEVISYTNLVKFAEYYKRAKSNSIDQSLKVAIDNLKYVKFLRNAAAHNNPLLRNIRVQDYPGGKRTIIDFFNSIKSLEGKQKVFLKNSVIHHLIATLYTFDLLVSSKGVKKHTYEELEMLLERCKKNKEYYQIPMYVDIINKYKFINNVAIYLKNKA